MIDATPLPVRVISDHGNWWLDVFIPVIVPVASLLISALAALCAALALRYIGKQIAIANRQTDVAEKDFEATIMSLKIAQEQAELARADRASRTPTFALSVERVRVAHGVFTEAPLKA